MVVKEKIFFFIHSAFIATLCAVLFGAYFVEFFLHHSPCRLCYLQRIGLLLSAISLVIGLYRFSFASLGLCLMSSLFGALVALRHNCLKYCEGISLQPHILGRPLPFWSLCAFVGSFLGVILLLFLIDERKKVIYKASAPRIFYSIIILAALIGTLSAYLENGLAL